MSAGSWVWVVQGDLAEGKRHAYSKRRWYVDEDSWSPVMSENYDSRGNLWRVGFFLSDYQFDIECYEDHPCLCGSSNCIGYIVSQEQWPELKKRLKEQG